MAVGYYKGHPVLRAFQERGAHNGKKATGWKFFYLHGIKSWETLPEQFKTPPNWEDRYSDQPAYNLDGDRTMDSFVTNADFRQFREMDINDPLTIARINRDLKQSTASPKIPIKQNKSGAIIPADQQRFRGIEKPGRSKAAQAAQRNISHETDAEREERRKWLNGDEWKQQYDKDANMMPQQNERGAIDKDEAETEEWLQNNRSNYDED